jgi:hypothetical protein
VTIALVVEAMAGSQPAPPQHDDRRAQREAMSIAGVWRMTAMISSTVGGSAG